MRHVNHVARKNTLMSMLEGLTDDITFERVYEPFEKELPLRAAVRLLRFHWLDLLKFHQLVTRATAEYTGRNVFFNNLMVLDKAEVGKVTVYGEIPLTPIPNLPPHWDITIYDNGPALLETFASTYAAAIADSRKAKAWTPASRGWARLKRRQSVTIAQALTRFTNLPSLLRDHQIAAIAEAVLDGLRPVEIKFAETPEQFKEMYTWVEGSPISSCMIWRPGKSDWDEMAEHGHVPTSFFAYYPGVKGAYVLKTLNNGRQVVMVRAICYKVDGKWYYGRTYPADGPYTRKFWDTLAEAGMEPLNCGIDEAVEFTIPGIPSSRKKSGGYIMPLPYFDNLGGHLYARFDEDTKLFHVTSSDKRGYIGIDMRSTSGFVDASYVTRAECSVCGSGTREPIRHQSTGAVYCCESCMARDGAVYATRSDGQRVVINRADAFQDAGNVGAFYTNEEAASRNGARPYHSSFLVREEDPGLSIYGTVIEEAGVYSSIGIGMRVLQLRLGRTPTLRDYQQAAGIIHEFKRSHIDVAHGWNVDIVHPMVPGWSAEVRLPAFAGIEKFQVVTSGINSNDNRLVQIAA